MSPSACPCPDDVSEFSEQDLQENQCQVAVDCDSDCNLDTAGCPNCCNPNYDSSTWCNQCGYYALLGKCIELADYDRDVEPAVVEDDQQPPQRIWRSIPAWSLQLAAAVVVVGGLSVAGRLLTATETAPRWTWSTIQALCGFVLFLVAHVRIAFIALSQNRSLQFTDAIMTPVRVWLEACMDFRRVSSWLAVGVGGLWAVVLAHALLGVPYGRLFTHEEAPAKEEEGSGSGSTPMGAGKSKKNMTMEEAMNEFSEKAGAKKAADATGDLQSGISGVSDATKEQHKVEQLDCVIIGYKRAADGRDSILSLVVAVPEVGQWKVLGMVHNGLTPDIQREISLAAQSLHRGKPIVECRYSATWLEPVLHCQIEAEYPPEQALPNRLKLINLN